MYVCKFLNKPSVISICAETWLKLSLLVNLLKNAIVCVKIYVWHKTSGFAKERAKLIALHVQKFAKKFAPKFTIFAQKIYGNFVESWAQIEMDSFHFSSKWIDRFGSTYLEKKTKN